MKKYTFLLSIALLVSMHCSAQFKKEHKEKIRAYKIAFLTDKLDLTEAEATKFWPIYNEYDKQNMELRREERFRVFKKIRESGGYDNLTEAEASNILNEITRIREERHKIKTRFIAKLRTVLSNKKIVMLEFSEHEFGRKLLRKLRGKHKN